jgi:hypothetical protein
MTPCTKTNDTKPTCTVHGCFLVARTTLIDGYGLPVPYLYCPVGKTVVRETGPTSAGRQ